MKPLLQKTLKTFILYALLVLGASIPVYYYMVDSIWLSELDEHNQITANRIENEFNKLKLDSVELYKSIELWNKVQPGTGLKKLSGIASSADSIYTVLRPNPYSGENDVDRFRGLTKTIQLNGLLYQLTVETNVEETEETVLAIALITFLFFLILVIGFILLTRQLSVKLWEPFRSSLSKLKAFKLNSQMHIDFGKSDTYEFEELNRALDKLIANNIAVYRSQKEFTENASHELQTPLAIIKGKLDLLLQNEAITEEQYKIVEAINVALARIARINRNLLLLAKIENHQFEDKETIDGSALLQQVLAQVQEHFETKQISIHQSIDANVQIEGNRTLVEIMITNLLLNAIRHNEPGGRIEVILNPENLMISNSGSSALDGSVIFNRFTKSNNENHGTGLGLAIVEQICIRHNWGISYQFNADSHVFSVSF